MKNLIKFFMVMAVLCTVAACSQTFEDVGKSVKEQETEQGRLVMNVGSESRTIMPIITENDIKSARLTADGMQIGSWSGNDIIGQIENDKSILLDVGIYDFEMTFCNENGNVFLIGTIDNKEIKAGDNSLVFDMKLVQGTGNIAIGLSWEVDCKISKIKAGLYDIATGKAVAGYEAEEIAINGTVAGYIKENVPSGQYIIKFELYDAADQLLNTVTDVVKVVAGNTTTEQKVLNNINTLYTIKYNLNGGSWKSGFTPVTVRNVNTGITLPTADNIKKTNYIFAGWYDEIGNKITEILGNTAKDITVTAKWRCTANTVGAVIKALSGTGPHDITVTGAITIDTISSIKTALQNNSNKRINLDLSDTTGLTSIGDDAFRSCSSLTSVIIPDSVTSIGSYAFSSCSSLTSVVIPDSVTSIGQQAFYLCDSLTSVTIPDSVTSIGVGAFYLCDSLTSVTIPDSVTSIGELAFTGCSSLTSVVIPDSVTSIGKETFYGCSSLTSIVIPDSVTSIGELAFRGCSKLTSIVIPDSVTSIGGEAFRNCSSLTSVTIPDSVTFIGSYAFSSCSSLTSVVIPDSVTTIGYEAFQSCSSLTSVEIGDSVTSIDYAAFYGCSSLTSVVIPDSVTSIGGGGAFSYCSSLESVTFKDTSTWYYTSNRDYTGGTAIDVTDKAQNATYLKSTYDDKYWYKYLETTVTVTADNVTDAISKLSTGGNHTVKVTGAITSDTISSIKTALQNNSLAYVNLDLSDTTGLTSIGGSAFSSCYSLTSVVIPDSVTSIGAQAFYNCDSLESVVIPDSVTSIGQQAFYECDSLRSVTIPDSVTSIGYRAFDSCSSLASVTIPDSVTSIGGLAFCYCSSLESIVIPDSVTSIGERAFSGCSSLTTVNYKGSQEQWGQISIGSYNGNLTNATINYNYSGE